MPKVIISENEWDNSIYRTKEWIDSVEITYWEHDFQNKTYTIIYKT
jgi:hypothetical protein